MAATTAELNSIPKRLFQHASNNGGTVGRSVWSPKGTTLRVIRCPTLQVSQFLFPGQRSDTFLTDHVNMVYTKLIVTSNACNKKAWKT
jgi:hypothetical protein